jgi:multidrug transporter EmrE-like cation transporter
MVLAPLLFATGMAIVDIFALGGVKYIHSQHLPLFKWILGPTLLYALQPWLLYKALSVEGLAVINIMWNLMSDILVTLLGIFYFKETLGQYKLLGLGFGILALILLNIAE